MSMGTLQFAWAASVVATAWFLAVGAIRMLAYRSGQVDHTPGMRNVAIMALSLGAVSAVCLVVFTVLIVVG